MRKQIGFNLSGKNYHIFTVDYTRDGGYFILPPKLENDRFLIEIINRDNFKGLKRIKRNKNKIWFTDRNPKLQHHIDGKAQVSGGGIISGFFKSIAKPKGIFIKSFDLRKADYDGGTILGILCWGLEKFPETKDQNALILTEDLIEESREVNEPLKHRAYQIEGLYFLKQNFSNYDQFKDKPFIIEVPYLQRKSLVYCTPSPDHCPGFLGFGIFKSESGFEINSGFSMSGAPGMINEQGFWDILNIHHPAVDYIKHSKDITLKPYHKVLYKTDDILYKIKRFFYS